MRIVREVERGGGRRSEGKRVERGNEAEEGCGKGKSGEDGDVGEGSGEGE